MSNILTSLLFSLVVGVLSIAGTWKIFQKLGEPGWKCLIPFYSQYTLYKHVWKIKYFFITLATSLGTIGACAGFFIMSNSVRHAAWEMAEEPSPVPMLLCLIIMSVLMITTFVFTILLNIHLAKVFGYGAPIGIALSVLYPVIACVIGFSKMPGEGPEPKGKKEKPAKKKKQKKTKTITDDTENDDLIEDEPEENTDSMTTEEVVQDVADAFNGGNYPFIIKTKGDKLAAKWDTSIQAVKKRMIQDDANYVFLVQILPDHKYLYAEKKKTPDGGAPGLDPAEIRKPIRIYLRDLGYEHLKK